MSLGYPELISQLSDRYFQYAVLHVFVLQGILDNIYCLFYFIALVFFRDLTILVWLLCLSLIFVTVSWIFIFFSFSFLNLKRKWNLEKNYKHTSEINFSPELFKSIADIMPCLPWLSCLYKQEYSFTEFLTSVCYYHLILRPVRILLIDPECPL